MKRQFCSAAVTGRERFLSDIRHVLARPTVETAEFEITGIEELYSAR